MVFLCFILFFFSLIGLGIIVSARFPNIFGESVFSDIPHKYLGYGAIVVIFLLMGSSLGIMYGLHKHESENASTSVKQQSPKTITTTDYKGKKQEILDAFNEIMSNNNAKIFYAGVRHSSPDKLTVYVHRTYLLDSQIKDFSAQCANVWKGITWARIQSKVIFNNFEVEIVDRDSGKIIDTSKFYEKPQ